MSASFIVGICLVAVSNSFLLPNRPISPFFLNTNSQVLRSSKKDYSFGSKLKQIAEERNALTTTAKPESTPAEVTPSTSKVVTAQPVATTASVPVPSSKAPVTSVSAPTPIKVSPSSNAESDKFLKEKASWAARAAEQMERTEAQLAEQNDVLNRLKSTDIPSPELKELIKVVIAVVSETSTDLLQIKGITAAISTATSVEFFKSVDRKIIELLKRYMSREAQIQSTLFDFEEFLKKPYEEQTAPLLAPVSSAPSTPQSTYIDESVLAVKSNTQLAVVAGDASRSAVKSVATAVQTFVAVSNEFLKSEEAKESRKAAALAGEAFREAAGGVGSSLSAVKTAWSSPGPEGDAFKSLQAVLGSADLKAALSQISTGTVRGSKEVFAAMAIAASTIAQSLGQSLEWNASISDLSDQLVLLLNVIKVALLRVSGFSKELPAEAS